MKALVIIKLQIFGHEQELKGSTDDITMIRSMLPHLQEAEHKRKEEEVKEKEER